jgi:hypothetical protein
VLFLSSLSREHYRVVKEKGNSNLGEGMGVSFFDYALI